MKIAHFADIHIRSLLRHEEYKTVFEEIFNKLSTEIKPDLNILAGDIWHTKTQGLTAEAIELMCWFFTEFAKTAPTLIMLGNHDLNLNGSRMDVISPIIKVLDNPRLKLILNCEAVDWFYKDEKCKLCFYPLTKKEEWDSLKQKLPLFDKETIKLAIFHGSIAGCQTDNDWVMDHGEAELDFFKGHDFALLGDIHKRQFLGYRCDKNGQVKPWIGYCGSTIQQNFGESTDKGFLVWDIKSKTDWDVKFVGTSTSVPFLTFPWPGSHDLLLESIRSTNPPKGARVRIVSEEYVPQQEKREIVRTLQTIFDASEVRIKDAAKAASNIIQTDTMELRKKSLRNDLSTLQKLYLEYLVLHDTNHNLSDEQVKDAVNLIEKYLSELNKIDDDDDIRDIVWSLESMKFSNTFKYGENNWIDFTKLNGVVGIFGNNAVGKSSLFGTLMYNLYNTTDRGPIKSAFIINDNANSCEAESIIRVGKERFSVNRTTKRTGKLKASGKSVTALQLSKIGETTNSNENDDSRTDTDKVLRKKIGTADDLLTTSFSAQNATTRFIDDGATQRKLFLNKCLDLDVFEKLQNLVSEDVNLISLKIKSLDPKTTVELEGMKQKLVQLNSSLEDFNNRKQQHEDKIIDVKAWLISHKNSLDTMKELTRLTTEKEKLDKSKVATSKELNELTVKLESKRALLESERNKMISREVIGQLEVKEEKLSSINESIARAQGNKDKLSLKLNVLEKSVKKLPLVPCGNLFPTCMFIKESHEHLQELNSGDLQKQIELVVDTFKHLKVEQDELIKANVKQELELARKTLNNIHYLELEIENLSANTQKLTAKLVSIDEEIASNNNELAKFKKDQLPSELAAVKTEELNNNQRFLAAVSNEVTRLEKEIFVLDQKIKTTIEYNEQWTVLTQRLKMLNSVFGAFSKNGIPALVLKTQLPLINSEIDNILGGLVDFTVTLDTTVATSNVLDVYIEDSKGKRIVELGSGMQKFIASLAIRVALTILTSLPKPDFFVLDEGFGVLDQNGLQKVIDFLSVLRGLFKTVFVITHNTEIKQMVDHVIEIDGSGETASIQL